MAPLHHCMVCCFCQFEHLPYVPNDSSNIHFYFKVMVPAKMTCLWCVTITLFCGDLHSINAFQLVLQHLDQLEQPVLFLLTWTEPSDLNLCQTFPFVLRIGTFCLTISFMLWKTTHFMIALWLFCMSTYASKQCVMQCCHVLLASNFFSCLLSEHPYHLSSLSNMLLS